MQQTSTNCCKLALTICPSLFTFSSRFRGTLPKLVGAFMTLIAFMTLAAAGLPFVEGHVGSSPGHYSFSHQVTHVA